MVEEGIIDQFLIDEVYALHNIPGHDVGVMYTRSGPIMAVLTASALKLKEKVATLLILMKSRIQ